ncbi:phosphatase PAP2 family protein [Candidatus Woesearchaeota archaeon]|nr:phosphatase PAP2 family protein [Candidatus Woesearchaeota archaeon]
MGIIKKYTKDAFIAITSLGTAFFYSLIILFLLVSGQIKIAIHLIIGLFICYLLVFILRLFYFKERPKKEEHYNLFTKINASSFPSLHMMSSLYVATVLSTHIKKPAVSVFLFLLSLLIGYSRMYLKKHYFIDVLFGFILGLVASFVYFFLINFS